MFDAMLQDFVPSEFKTELHFRTTTPTFCTHYHIPVLAFIIMFPAYIYCFQFFHCTCHCFQFRIVTSNFAIFDDSFQILRSFCRAHLFIVATHNFNLIISPSATEPCFRRMDSSACKTAVTLS